MFPDKKIPMTDTLQAQHAAIMREVLDSAHHNRHLHKGRPFAAAIADDAGRILGRGVNTISQTQDMTGHAEMEAIRDCCRQRQLPHLQGLTVYASGHPCPMCLAAIVAGQAKQVFFAFDNADAAPFGLSSEGVYQRLGLQLQPPPLPIHRLNLGISAAQLYGDAPWPSAG